MIIKNTETTISSIIKLEIRFCIYAMDKEVDSVIKKPKVPDKQYPYDTASLQNVLDPPTYMHVPVLL